MPFPSFALQNKGFFVNVCAVGRINKYIGTCISSSCKAGCFDERDAQAHTVSAPLHYFTCATAFLNRPTVYTHKFPSRAFMRRCDFLFEYDRFRSHNANFRNPLFILYICAIGLVQYKRGVTQLQ